MVNATKLAMLVFENIVYQVGPKKILTHISSHIDPGRMTAIVGPNGAGKSTLLNILAGELTPTIGEVRVNDTPLNDWSALDLARMRAVLPQRFDLSFDFTVHEVVRMGRMPHDNPLAAPLNSEVCEDALRQVGMLELADRLYPTLSGGEQQRVQLARVLAQIWPLEKDETPRYLLLDEPTSNLDLHQQHTVLTIAKSWVAQHVGTLVVLHDLNLAIQYADATILMDQGTIIAAGNTLEVLTADCIKQIFHVQATFVNNPYAAARPWLVTAPLG